MRESNFAFPAQNRASVSISSQLYDRRALDTSSALPLFNSLTHLTYLTSTSPRIREIMTFDGGLERLVQILRDFCLHPPSPENPSLMYGLSPTPIRPVRRTPALVPQSFDKHAAYRFSLAFQSIVNIGVRGSEEIRARVVQAGTLDVVGCILEAWLASRGYPVGPSASSAGLHRESREQRLARRAAQAAATLNSRQQIEAAELQRALRRQLANDQRVAGRETTQTGRRPLMEITPRIDTAVGPDVRPGSASASETNSDTEQATVTPGVETPTGAVTVPGRERSGTVIGRPVWEQGTVRGRRVPRVDERAEGDSSADISRAETETEDDGEADVDMDRSAASESPSPAPSRRTSTVPHARRAVGIVEDEPEAGPSGTMPSDPPHIIVESETVVPGTGAGVADGLVNLEPNDDFALGAPPGAPGAIDGAVPAPNTVSPAVDRFVRMAPDVTPRAMATALPATQAAQELADFARMQDGRTGPHQRATIQPLPAANPTVTNTATLANYLQQYPDIYPRQEGPYRDEDVLLGLQLLAYLSKYPHVRQAFYKTRASFHPAAAPTVPPPPAPHRSSLPDIHNPTSVPSIATPSTEQRHGFLRALATVRGKDKRPSGSDVVRSAEPTPTPPPPPPRMVNVFSLVERFTFRPSSSECEMPGMPPPLPPDIQYWAGVIMRNACRKDDTRGGIRQCANMLCGRWETYPREFAKCRRCRKAKYCGKECQSSAWSEGHRFWCSAKDADEDAAHAAHAARVEAHAQSVAVDGVDDAAVMGGMIERPGAPMPNRTDIPGFANLLQQLQAGAVTAADGRDRRAAQATWGWDRAPAGVPEDVGLAGVTADVGDLFTMFNADTGIVPAADGMRVEDGVLRVDDDLVRVRRGDGPSGDEAMVLD